MWGRAPYAPCSVPIDPRVYRARGRAALDRGVVGEREVVSQRDAFLVDELVINFVPDLNVFGRDRGTEDDDHVFGQIRFYRNVLGGHSAGGGHRDPAAWWPGSVLTGRGRLRDGWRGSRRKGVVPFQRAVRG